MKRCLVCTSQFLLLLGCAVGFVMVSNNSGVFQGSVGSGFGNRTAAYLGPDRATVGPEYLLLRPATRGGDLVLPHAIGVHGLVLLAVPAVLLTRTTLSRTRQLRLVALAAGSVGLAMTLLLVNAFRSLPLDRLGPVLMEGRARLWPPSPSAAPHWSSSTHAWWPPGSVVAERTPTMSYPEVSYAGGNGEASARFRPARLPFGDAYLYRRTVPRWFPHLPRPN